MPFEGVNPNGRLRIDAKMGQDKSAALMSALHPDSNMQETSMVDEISAWETGIFPKL